MAEKPKILVTGASGQFGRRLIRELIKRGYIIRAHYRSQEKADKYRPDGVEIALGDMTKPDWIDDAVAGCDMVIHGAARVSVRPLSRVDTEYMYKVNVAGTRAVVEACVKAGVRRLLHISSVAAVGGSADGSILDETAVFNLAGLGMPYFETKRESEEIALSANSDKFEVVVVNPSIMISIPDREITAKDLKKIPKRIPVYFDFGLNLVETADAIDGSIRALENGRPGQRYILGGDNIGPQKLFAMGEKYFGIKKPFFKIPMWGIYIAGLIAEFVYLFKNKKPKLNRNITKLLKLKLYYSSNKARNELGYKPRRLSRTLEDILATIRQ
ncbi:MAG: SDR family NAD(P)-dependent oxidoreductase [candidate division Zixibacteria bacterium]|nr:SDR family NAD(P)-dependent oxidoreductase [candidate division Zixibacteria bacterium]